MSNELKPCPFCGGEAHARAQHWEDGSRGWWLVECAECGAEGMHCDDRKHAIEAWNTRAERTCRMEYNEDWSGDELYPTVAYQCSACGGITQEGRPHYCPNCGAKVVDG